MTPAERRAFKNELRSAISRRARGLPLTAAEDAALGRLIRFRTGALAFSILAYHERCSTRTLQSRIAAILDRCFGA
jgi:hypothetical protein